MWIAEWLWDDDNVAHLARHGVTARQVVTCWRNDPKFRRNKRGRAATHQMVGPDAGGRFVAVFVVEVEPGRWRAIAARPATEAERHWWERS